MGPFHPAAAKLCPGLALLPSVVLALLWSWSVFASGASVDLSNLSDGTFWVKQIYGNAKLPGKKEK